MIHISNEIAPRIASDNCYTAVHEIVCVDEVVPVDFVYLSSPVAHVVIGWKKRVVVSSCHPPPVLRLDSMMGQHQAIGFDCL